MTFDNLAKDSPPPKVNKKCGADTSIESFEKVSEFRADWTGKGISLSKTISKD